MSKESPYSTIKLLLSRNKRKTGSMRHTRTEIKEKEVKLEDISTNKEIPSQKQVKHSANTSKKNMPPKQQNIINIDTSNTNIFDDQYSRTSKAKTKRNLKLKFGKKNIRKIKPGKLFKSKDPITVCRNNILDSVIKEFCTEIIKDLPKEIKISHGRPKPPGTTTMTPSGASRDISVERNLSMQRKRFHRRNFSRPADRTLPVIDQKPMRFSPPTELFSDPRILDEKSFQRLRQQERQKQVQKLRENNRKAGGFSAFSPIRRPRIKQNYKQIINFLSLRS